MLSPQQLTHRLNEALAHHKAGRLDRAEAIYRQLALTIPRAAAVFDLWGQLAEQQGRFEEAARHFARACECDAESLAIVARLAQAHVSLGRASEAEKVLRRFTEKNPLRAEAWNALGFVLKLEGRIAEAFACHQKAVTINPKFVEGWVHCGLTLGVIGQSCEALPYYDRALALDPQHATAHYGRAQTLHKVYRFDDALAEYDAYLRLMPDNLEAQSYRLFALQNSDRLTREQLFAEHRAYGHQLAGAPATLPGYNVDPNRRLRVAMLSPDLRTHSCAYFLEPLLRHLSPAEFEVYLYHDHFSEDAVSARLRQHAAVWRNFVGQPNAAVEKTIRQDRPDILIDLTGHIGVSIRLPIMAKRLAPVQVTYLGYPDTTGVPAMDYRFTDPQADPPGEADEFATEKLVRFAPVAWAYEPPLDAPDVAPPPGATPAGITFGCFNSATKFNDSLLTVWARLLNRVPGARLRLKGRDFDKPAVRDHLVAWMRRCGLPVERVDLVPRTTGTREHLDHYAQIDIALDTFPYNGTTTTCEALWMGRPVVTLRGNRHASRVGASLLAAVGHAEWIAGSTDEYIAVAAMLAANPVARGLAASTMRSSLQRSLLMDHAGQAGRFADALRACWQEKTRTAGPELSSQRGAGMTAERVETPGASTTARALIRQTRGLVKVAAA